MELTEHTLESTVVYEGIIVNVRRDVACLPNGKRADREVVEHPGGVAVLPLTDDGCVLTVRQHRYPFACTMLELPAGKLERGEDPRACALRELQEEVGATPAELISLGALALSPGFCDEVLHLYLARGLTFGAAHPDEDEFLEPVSLPFDDLVDNIMSGAVTDAKTVAGVLKTKVLLGL